jgi:histidinol-phosphate aminotransferase
MDRILTVTRDSLDQLLEQLAHRLDVDTSSVIPFTDFTDMMTALLEHVGNGRGRLLIAGHASPDIAIAAERAGLRSEEIVGASPFVSHPEDILEAVDNSANLVYLANPNRVTGSSYSLSHLKRIAQRIPDGTLILDEKYYDYYGISGRPLLDRYSHVVIARSLTAGFNISSDESGCLVGCPGFMSGFKNYYQWSRITSAMFRLLSTSLANGPAAAKRLTQVHDELLRIANELTGIGVQNRITSADFLLLRVADPRRVANFVAGFGAPLENLEMYPDLQNYLRYRVQSPLSNDNFLTAFRRMPSEYYHMADIDRRVIMFHRPGESVPGGPSDQTKDRGSTAVSRPSQEEVPV